MLETTIKCNSLFSKTHWIAMRIYLQTVVCLHVRNWMVLHFVLLLFFSLSVVKRQSLKVQINATDDTVCMRYLRPSQNTKLEGFVLGYGSSFFSNQYIPLPSDGSTYINELGNVLFLSMLLLSWCGNRPMKWWIFGFLSLCFYWGIALAFFVCLRLVGKNFRSQCSFREKK